jgi:hypothetical protein
LRVFAAALLLALAALDLATAAYAALRGPFPIQVPLGTPLAYRNIYLHVPIAIGSYVALFLAFASGVYFLARGSRRALSLMDSFVAAGVVLAAGTIVTGMAWASESWGAPWNWDPKQTAVLLLMLAYMAYFPLKRSIADPERAARVGAAYVVAAFTLVPIAYLSSRVLESLHPSGEQAQAFIQSGEGGPLFLARIILFASIVVAAGAARAAGGLPLPRWAPLAAAAFGLAVAAASAYPLLSGGEAYRVVGAEVTESGMIESVTLSSPAGEVRIEFPSPVESPVSPPLTPEGYPSILGHIVRVAGDRLEVLPHWSTPFTVAVHAVILSLLLYLARGGGRR